MDEYIKRKDVLELSYWHGEHPTTDNPFPSGVDAVDTNDIEAIPAADVRPVVKGEWIGMDCSYWRHAAWGAYPVNRMRYKCSVCGRIENQKEPFCNCGAKMGGDT